MKSGIFVGVLAVGIGFGGPYAFADASFVDSGQWRVAQSSSSDTKCPDVIIPVCAIKDGKKIEYNNECEAKRDGATDIKPGKCGSDR